MVKALWLILTLAAALPATAQVYSFADERGVVHLTDVPDDARYRALDEPAPSRRAPAPIKRPYAEVVDEAARAAGVDAALIHAVIAVESAYDSRAVSPRGAAGLMQLMAPTALQYGVVDRFDPSQNVRAGARHLQELLALFGNDVELALAAYNAGARAVLRYGRRIPPYPETLAYVPRVMHLYVRNAAGR